LLWSQTNIKNAVPKTEDCRCDGEQRTADRLGIADGIEVTAQAEVGA